MSLGLWVTNDRVKALPAFRLPIPHLSLRVPQSVVDKDWPKAEEKQPILYEMKTKDDKPLKTAPRGRHRDRKRLDSKTGRGKPAQGRFGIDPWK